MKFCAQEWLNIANYWPWWRTGLWLIFNFTWALHPNSIVIARSWNAKQNQEEKKPQHKLAQKHCVDWRKTSNLIFGLQRSNRRVLWPEAEMEQDDDDVDFSFCGFSSYSIRKFFSHSPISVHQVLVESFMFEVSNFWWLSGFSECIGLETFNYYSPLSVPLKWFHSNAGFNSSCLFIYALL